MSSFQIPKLISNYLNLNWRKPPENFFNCSNYYANLSTYFMNYMNTVVRPCIAYQCGGADGIVNSGLKMNVGFTIKKTAVKILSSNKYFFEGADLDCGILSDKWVGAINFNKFLVGLYDNLMCGTTILKLNKDIFGRCIPTTERVDRFYCTYNDIGDIIRVVIFNSELFKMNFGNAIKNSFWLVEERFYKGSVAYVRYKVQCKTGTAGHDILPSIYGNGVEEKDLPVEVVQQLQEKNIRLNQDIKLGFRDGLGVWNLTLTAVNSAVPNLPMGDPLLFGALDLLWAIDVLFSGSLTDVIIGKGKLLIPKRFINVIREDFKRMGINSRVDTDSYIDTSIHNDDDDSFVYIATERDKDFPPTNVQFDIRSEQYRGMLEIYLRQVCSICGFAPTSIFPFLADGSNKTATEVNGEENLTRATVEEIQKQVAPILDRMLDEVLYQLYKQSKQKYEGNIHIKLGNYIGNKIQRDQNIRDNVSAGLTPKEVAVQQINDISAKETQEYMQKIKEDKQSNDMMFNEKDYFNDSEIDNQPASDNAGGSGNGNKEDMQESILHERTKADNGQENPRPIENTERQDNE